MMSRDIYNTTFRIFFISYIKKSTEERNLLVKSRKNQSDLRLLMNKNDTYFSKLQFDINDFLTMQRLYLDELNNQLKWLENSAANGDIDENQLITLKTGHFYKMAKLALPFIQEEMLIPVDLLSEERSLIIWHGVCRKYKEIYPKARLRGYKSCIRHKLNLMYPLRTKEGFDKLFNYVLENVPDLLLLSNLPLDALNIWQSINAYESQLF